MLQTIHKRYVACILFAVSALLFVRTIRYDAVWDDTRVHFNSFNQQKMNNDISAFWKDQPGMYIPLTYTTWAIVKKIFSAEHFNPLPFHLLNVLIHSTNGVLLFYLLLLLFKNKTTAFTGSLFFIIHPLQVESVAWISEFRGLYSTFFCLTSLLFFFSALEKKQIKNLSALFFSKDYWLAFIFYILALLAKPSGIVLPFIVLILCHRYYKELVVLIGKSLSLWILPAAVIIFLLLVKNPESYNSIGQRFLIAGYTLFFYLQKIIIPYPLAACYGYTPNEVACNSFSYSALIICIVIIAGLFLKRNTFPDVYAAVMIVIVCVMPVSGFIPFEYQDHSTVADRYMYMGIIGLTVLIPPVEKFIRTNYFLKAVAGFVLIALSVLTIKQTNTWKNEFSLWDHSLTFYDNSSKAHYNRGVEYSIKGNFENAIIDYTRALEIAPNYTDALFNRANAYENSGKPEAALTDYNTCIGINPKAGDVYYKRSYLFMKSGELDKALDDLQRAEELGFPVDRRYKEVLLKLRFKDNY